MSLVVQHLTEENYRTWSRAVLISLDAKSKMGFIDGSIPKPQFVEHPCYTAREVWLDLYYRYSQGNVPRIFELR